MVKSILSILVVGILLSACATKDETRADLGVDISPNEDVSGDQNTKDVSVDTKDADTKDLVATDTALDVAVDTAPDLSAAKLLKLIRTKDNAEFPFTDFYYGKNTDGTLRVELMVKGTGSCPTMNSPTPEATMILNINPDDQTHKDAIVLDFEGFFDTINPNHPTTLNVDEFTFDVFGETIGMQLSGVDKHDVSHFSFTGQIYATYCPSLDE